MENKPNFDELNQDREPGRNESGDSSFTEAERRITNSKFSASAPSDEFERRLKSQLQEQREQNSMKLSAFTNLFKRKYVVPAFVTVLLVAIIAVGTQILPALFGDDFKKLLISPAYAMDNFTVEATKSDSIGVENDTAFIIKSKDAITDAEILRDNLKLTPDVEFDFKKVDDHTFTVTPKHSLENRTVYNLSIDASYQNEQGMVVNRDYGWAFQVKDTFKALQTLPRDKATMVPVNSGIEITLSHENFSNWEQAFSISPKVNGRFEKHKRTLVFVPESLQAGVLYTVTLNKNLVVEGSGAKLEQDIVFRFETESFDGDPYRYRNSFGFTHTFNEYATTREPALQIFQYNVDNNHEFAVQVYRYPNSQKFIDDVRSFEAIPYWASATRVGFQPDLGSLQQQGTYQLKSTTFNDQRYLVLPTRLPEGFYVAVTEFNGKKEIAFLTSTNLSAFASVTETKTLVWVNDVVTGEAVANASVSLLGGGSGRTGTDGVATVDTANAPESSGRSVITVSANGSEVVLPIDTYYNASYKQERGYTHVDDYWYHFYTDRGLYQTEDTIHFWGVIKPRSGVLSTNSVTVRLVNSNGIVNYYYEPIVISGTEVAIDERGSFTGSLDLRDINPGYYNLEVRLGDTLINTQYLDIQKYVKPAYQLTVDFERDNVYAGETLKANVKAAFFDGTPVPNLSLKYSWYPQEGTVTTNERGEATVSIQTSYDAKNYYPMMRDLEVYPEKSEEGEIRGYALATVFGPRLEASADVEEIDDDTVVIATTAQNINLDLIAPDTYYYNNEYLAGPAAGARVSGSISKITYNRVETGEHYDFINKVKQKTYRYDRVVTPAGSFSGTTDAQGIFRYEFTGEKDAAYEASIEVYDQNNRVNKQSVYFSMEEYASPYGGGWYDYHWYGLRFKDNKTQKTFNLGDRVELSFRDNEQELANPSGRFLYYTMANGLVDYGIGSNEYAFTFEEKHVPNVNIVGVWFDGSTYRRTYYLGSQYQIGLNTESKKLNITVTPDKQSYKPGEEATLQVEVKDQNNNPVSAALNVSMVDEALFALSEHNGNALASLYRPVSSGELGFGYTHKLPEVGSGAEGGGCFIAGTKVLMADGSEKNIEDVQPGDRVLTFENERTNVLVPANVVETFVHTVSGYLLINGTIGVTPEHRVFINGGWQMIGEARVGDFLTDRQGNPVRINSIEHVPHPVTVYNLHIETYHTFIADGVYVHNDKGGVRQNFVDTALFASLSTDRNGKASVKVTMPDNVTSWRLTTQAVGDGITAGTTVTNVPVTLPFFIEASYGREYVAGDKPTVKLRAFGTLLKSGMDVVYSFAAKSLGMTAQSQNGKAFAPTYFTIPELKIGQHAFEGKGEISGHDDTVIKTVSVVPSRLTKINHEYYQLSDQTSVQGATQGYTELTFSDSVRGPLLQELYELSWSWGNRVDQRLVRKISRELINKHFGKEYPEVSFDAAAYQVHGVTLLPYSDEDYALSAKVAGVAADEFDQGLLSGYFYGKLNSKDSSREEVGLALLGLASMKEPVLLAVQNYASLDDLSTMEKLYSGLAAYNIGDIELARTLYYEVMNENAETLEPYVRLNIGDDQDTIVDATSFAAILAAAINDQFHDELWRYVADNRGEETLVNLEKLWYLKNQLPNVTAEPVGFTVHIGDKTVTEELDAGETHGMVVSADELKQMSFSNIKGSVGLAAAYEVPLAAGVAVSEDVGVTRRYVVNGKQTTTFSQNDLVEVRITPQFGAKAVDGLYQVVDLLPSGMTIVTSPYTRGKEYSSDLRYPYEVDGQVIKFIVTKQTGSFKYYARINAPGTYVAEPVVLQSSNASSVFNRSEATTVTINP